MIELVDESFLALLGLQPLPQLGSSATDLLEQFLQSLKNSLADSTYSAKQSSNETKASDPSMSGVLINDRI